MCYKKSEDDELIEAMGCIPVYENTEEDHRIAYEPIRGMYCLGVSDFWASDLDYDSVMWPKEFRQRTYWLDVRDPPYLLYKAKGTYKTDVFTEREYRTHIVHNGSALCNRSMSVPSPDSDTLTPISELTEEEVDTRRRDMCANCPSLDSILSKSEE